MIVVALAACGRVGFEPTVDGARPPTDDGAGTGDGTMAIDAAVDALPVACAEAIPVQLDTRMTIDTCTGMNDRFGGCGPPGTQEVVFAFTAPASRGYTFGAYTTGTNNISNSSGRIDTACGATMSCSGLTGFSMDAGDTVYIVVEAAAGGCVTIDFLVD